MTPPRAELRREADGTWYCRPYLGTSASGRRIRPYRSWPADMAEADVRALADAWVASLTGAGRSVPPMLADALDAYVDAMEARGAAPNTVRSYRACARTVAMAMPGARVDGVDAADVDEAELSLLTRGGASGRPMAGSSVAKLHWFLAGAFDWAVARGARADNPVRSVTPPSRGQLEATALDSGGLAAVEGWCDARLSGLGPAMGGRECRQAVMAMAFWLALHAGLRVGEACALTMRDAEATGGTVAVRGTVYEGDGAPRRRAVTKGRRPRRVALSPAELGRLWAFASWQRRRLGLRAAEPLLTLDGSWLAPSVVSGEFRRLARELGLPGGTRYHTLRHTHATWLVASGVDMKTVSERLGHADVATTMRLYAHVLPGRDQAAARAFEEAARRCASGVPEDLPAPAAPAGAKAQVTAAVPATATGPVP